MPSKIAYRMFGVQDVLISAQKLTELPGIFVDETVESIEYHHILLDEHEVVYAEGAPSESLFTGRKALISLTQDGLEEVFTIFPGLKACEYLAKPARYIPSLKLRNK